MNSIVNHMGKYNHRQHVLSDWLTELEKRFQLGDVETDKGKITWCQLLIGATGSGILAGLEDDASWEIAKETRLSRLGVVSVRDEAWAALKELKRGSKEIVELAGEAEKLAKRLHPRDAEAAECHAIDAFLGAVDRSLAAEVQKLGCRTMEEVVAAARRIEWILSEQPDSKIEQIVLSMQNQIWILTKDLKKAHEQMASQAAAATPTAALAAIPAATVTAAQPPPVTSPPAIANAHPPPAAPLPPLVTTQPPPYPPGLQMYHDYGEEGPYFRAPRRQPDRRPPRCFLCDEEGHFAYRCPARSLLQRLLQQQARETAHGPARDQVLELPASEGSQGSPPGAFKLLEGSSEAKVNPVGWAVGPPITGQLTLEGIPVLGLVDTGASVTCLRFSVWWRYSAQWGPLRQFEGTVHGAHDKLLQIAGKTQNLNLQWGEARGRDCFIVIVGLESPPCLIGMDIMRPLRVHIDVMHGTATSAQPDPQTVHLNAAQKRQQPPGKNDLAALETACSPQKPQQRKRNAVARRPCPPKSATTKENAVVRD